MDNLKQKNRKAEAGFTLVELAIVMIIIGLLIGGVLKGQELINNAEVSSTVAQIKNIDAGINTFRDSYQTLPGDQPRAVARIANCAGAVPCVNGNGDGNLGVAVDIATPVTEAVEFWRHLGAADMVAGVDGSTNVAIWGAAQPATSVGGGLTVGFTGNGALVADTAPGATAIARSGHYLTLRQNPSVTASGFALTPAQAFRIDNKMDNGAPNSGTTIALGAAGAAACVDAATPAGVYREADGGVLCGLYIRVQ